MIIDQQKSTELARFLRLIERYECRSYLEVGAAGGETFLFIGSTMERAVAVNLLEPKNKTLLQRADDLRMRLGVQAEVLVGDSRDPDIVRQAESRGPYDLVFIDGDHSLKGVATDFLNYLPMASKLIAFHDILGNHSAGAFVDDFWRRLLGVSPELREASSEFCETWGKRPMGIGVIPSQVIPATVPSEILEAL